MTTADLFNIWPGQPVFSAAILAFVLAILLYFARAPAHLALLSAGSVLRNGLRMMARSIVRGEQRLSDRNREVLLAAGLESSERLVEQEFRRIEAAARLNLDGYPALHRKLMEQVTAIDEDYRKTADIPPEVPGWVDAVEAIAKIKTKGEPVVADVLGDIHLSLEKACDRSLTEYRKSSRERHRLLGRMMGYWRSLTDRLEDVDKSIVRMLERAQVIDRQMEAYGQIRSGTEQAVRTLSSSSYRDFVISAFVLVIAIGGAIINFKLIAAPMQEMVGGSDYIFNRVRTADVAALVIILVEVAMGLFLMESLRITRLFPLIHALDDRLRIRMVWITFAILLTLAGIESALAYMRDLIALDAEALRQSLASAAVATSMENRWIPTVGQMVLGFILPFALAFVAIPLESFVHSSRTVLGVALTGLLRFVAGLFRILGNLAFYSAASLVRIYDLVIFAPLWLESVITKNSQQPLDKKRNKDAKVEKFETSARNTQNLNQIAGGLDR